MASHCRYLGSVELPTGVLGELLAELTKECHYQFVTSGHKHLASDPSSQPACLPAHAVVWLSTNLAASRYDGIGKQSA